MTIDLKKGRDRLGIQHLGKALDGGGHLCIRRRRGDLAAGPAHPAQAQHIVAASCGVEELDRVRAKGGGNRCVGVSEGSPGVGVVGDEGVHQLEGGDLLFALGGGEGADAELVNAIADPGRQRRREA